MPHSPHHPPAPTRAAPPHAACPYCGSMTPALYVHGHAQCDRCGVNIEPCCSGEVCQAASTVDQAATTPPPAAHE